MRYEIDIKDNDVLTIGDEDGTVKIGVVDGDGVHVGTFFLDEAQLEELIHAIDLIKSLRPKKSINVPGLPYYPPGVRTYTTNLDARGNTIEDRQYEATSHADNPNG